MDITVTPWRRYGQDRLYLSTDGDVKLGWIDNKTGILTVVADEHRTVIEAWAKAHLDTMNATASALSPSTTVATTVPQISASTPDAPGPVAEPALKTANSTPSIAAPVTLTNTRGAAPVGRANWTDLANNVPGQGPRKEADKKVEAMYGKSRVLTSIARVLDINNPERSWRIGADGEETIGARLDKLTAKGWHVLHAVPIGPRGADIDHVLIGAAGVFCINTKNHPGKAIEVAADRIRIGGTAVDYYKKSRIEAERTTKILTTAVGWPVEVRPVLILLNGTRRPSIKTISNPAGILVFNGMEIPEVFTNSLPRLTPPAVEEIYTMARRSTTWALG